MPDDQEPDPVAVPVLLPNGETVSFYATETGRICCPVCGSLEQDAAPYDPETGQPSRAWCPSCHVQFGWDDLQPPDAPPGSYPARWAQLRTDWLRLESGPEARAQLARIRIDLDGA